MNAVLALASVAFLTLFSVQAAAQDTEQMEAAIDLRVTILSETWAETRSGRSARNVEVDRIDLVRGDPVSIRIVLTNNGDVATIPTRGLSLSIGATEATVTRPDGTVVTAVLMGRSVGQVTLIPAPPVAMQPGEEQVLETYLYESKHSDDQSRTIHTYLFDEPGAYTVIVKYKIGEAKPHITFDNGTSQTVPPAVTSAAITVNVLEASIPAWDELRDTHIEAAIGVRYWPALQDPTTRAQTQALIKKADRPWLTGWASTLEQSP